MSSGRITMRKIDAHNAILGRLASIVAKQLLAGETIIIVNAEKAIITGDPKRIKEKYFERRSRGSPQHGPFFPKKAEMIVRRTIRGMLPYKTNRGRAAVMRLRVYSGVPQNVEGAERIASGQVRSKFITVEKLAKSIGG